MAKFPNSLNPKGQSPDPLAKVKEAAANLPAAEPTVATATKQTFADLTLTLDPAGYPWVNPVNPVAQAVKWARDAIGDTKGQTDREVTTVVGGKYRVTMRLIVEKIDQEDNE